MTGKIQEFELTEGLIQRGISRIAKEDNTILVVYKSKPLRSGIFKDFNKTMKSLSGVLDINIDDEETKQGLKFWISSNWLRIMGLSDNTKDQTPTQSEKRVNVSYSDWYNNLVKKYDVLYNVVKSNLPNLWDSLEFELSVSKILNIAGCTLPFAGIVLGRPSSLKTVGIELFRKWKHAFYTDNFSPKSFVSHSTAVSKEELEDIDMLPKIKNKLFLTPELSPIFAKKDEDLVEILGIMIRLLDGHGYESDSGAHGHRGYAEEIMFVWIGAAVDIPRKVHKYLGTLGPKLYFLRLPKINKSEDDYLVHISRDDFASRIKKIEEALIDYLKWFENCPNANVENDIAKIVWNNDKDDNEAKRLIIKLAILLANLRGVVPTWETKDTEGTDYAYTMATMEEPDRAMIQLRNLARGHALSQGRNYLTTADISMIVKVVLSTASIERVRVLDLLIQNGGVLTTSQITYALNTTNPTAKRTMTEFKALELVEMSDLGLSNSEKKITLNERFKWLLTEEFQLYRNDFVPIDNSIFLKNGDEGDKLVDKDTRTIQNQKEKTERKINESDQNLTNKVSNACLNADNYKNNDIQISPSIKSMPLANSLTKPSSSSTPHKIYIYRRSPNSDNWLCEKCPMSGDIHFMKQHKCTGTR